MPLVRGTIRDGKVVFDAPPAWPDGTRVFVLDRTDHDELVMLAEAEADQGDDPESIARWLAAFDALEPLLLTPEDEERIRKAREEQKAWELANWEKYCQELEALVTGNPPSSPTS